MVQAASPAIRTNLYKHNTNTDSQKKNKKTIQQHKIISPLPVQAVMQHQCNPCLCGHFHLTLSRVLEDDSHQRQGNRQPGINKYQDASSHHLQWHKFEINLGSISLHVITTKSTSAWYSEERIYWYLVHSSSLFFVIVRLVSNYSIPKFGIWLVVLRLTYLFTYFL